MARSSAASPDVARGTVGAQPMTRRRVGQALRSRVVLLGFGLLILLGILAYGLVNQATTGRVATSTPPQSAPVPLRPPLTPAEEAYAHALWPIHTNVKLGALRMAFAGINYKVRKIDRVELKARVDASNEIYRRAEARVRALRPPPSLEEVQTYYLDALRVYQQAAAEMLKAFGDGRDEHLVTASPMMIDAGGKLLSVGTALWPGEYVPN